jgi:hypothetical protein
MKLTTVPSMDWPVMAVRAGAFCPVGSTVHSPRRQHDNAKTEEGGACEYIAMAHSERSWHPHKRNTKSSVQRRFILLTLPAPPVIPPLLARDPRPPRRLSAMAVVGRARQQLLVRRELVLTVERQGIHPAGEFVGVFTDLRVRHVDVPAIGRGEGGAPVAVGVVGEGGLGAVREGDLLSRGGDGHGREAVGEVHHTSVGTDDESGKGVAGRREITNNNGQTIMLGWGRHARTKAFEVCYGWWHHKTQDGSTHCSILFPSLKLPGS